MQRKQFHQRKKKRDTFYQPSNTDAPEIIGTEIIQMFEQILIWS